MFLVRPKNEQHIRINIRKLLEHSFTIQEISLTQLREVLNGLNKRVTESPQLNTFPSCPCSPTPPSSTDLLFKNYVI